MTNEEILKRIDIEVAKLKRDSATKSAITVRRLLAYTSDQQLKRALRPVVEQLCGSSPSGRYPSMARVRKMLNTQKAIAARNNDVDRRLVSNYVHDFERLASSGLEINDFVAQLFADERLDQAAISAIVAEITGGTLKRVTKGAAKRSIMMEFADRSVSRYSKQAAKDAKPF